MEPLISVIVPVYKVEKYLDRCVESIISQTYKNLEIILVNDGSPDRCGQMCEAWVVNDSRIKVLHKPNGGLSDARNAGIRAASGEYIVFVDSDDYIGREMIERLLRAAKKADSPMAICNVYCIDEHGVPTGESDHSPIRDEVLMASQILPRFYQELGQLYIVAWNKLYHRSLLNDEAFPVGKWHEDEFVAAQLIWKAGRVACIGYMGYCYVRQRDGSIMSVKDDPRHMDALEALLIRYRFYQEIGQKGLLHETRARVLKALEEYYWEMPDVEPNYAMRMDRLRQGYAEITGLPLKERFKWRLFEMNPKLERAFVKAMRRR